MNRRTHALNLVTTAFAGKVDKAGAPYIGHLLAVAGAVDHLGDDYYITALLHDLLDDCPGYTVAALRLLYGDRVATAVGLLSNPDRLPYMAYIRRLASDPIARAVKLADLAHNMDLSRFGTNAGAHGSLMVRYRKAQTYLLDVGGGHVG